MSNHLHRALAVLGTAALTTALAAAPAEAGTTTTFALTGGNLSISEPAPANLGTVANTAGTVSGQLGDVTVTDERGLLAATWTATVGTTTFTTGGGTANETIPKASVSYNSGAIGASSGLNGVFAGTAVGVALGTDQTAATGAAVGNNSATWNPTVTVTIPSQALAGTYTGTITHSVS